MFKADGYPELIQSFKLSLQVDDLKAQTIKHYTSDTKKFLEHISAIPPDDISPNHVRQYLDSLRARVSPKTIYEVQLALRKFFRFMSEEGRLNPIHTLTLSPSRTMSDEVDLSRRSSAVHQAARRLASACRLLSRNGPQRVNAIISLLPNIRAGLSVPMFI